MRVVVTGGAGYIGSHTLVELLEQGHDALVVDDFRNASPRALDRVRELTGRPFAVETLDVRDTARLATALCRWRPEAAIHFAGLKSVGQGERQPLDYWDVNVGGTVALLHALDAAGGMRVVFSSSATVYGEPRYLPFDEAHPLAPANVYGRTKAAAERVLADWGRGGGGACGDRAALFQPRGRPCLGPVGRGSAWRAGEPDALHGAGGNGSATRPADLRRRLADTRRNRNPRLHSCCRSGPGPCGGS